MKNINLKFMLLWIIAALVISVILTILFGAFISEEIISYRTYIMLVCLAITYLFFRKKIIVKGE